MAVWDPGDQLAREQGRLARAMTDERVLTTGARGFARRHADRPHKPTLVFSAMRHRRDESREAGHGVDYRRAEAFTGALDAHCDEHPGDEPIVVGSPSHGTGDRLGERGGEQWVASGTTTTRAASAPGATTSRRTRPATSRAGDPGGAGL